MSIAGDFSVLSSLSGGVRLDKTTLRQVWAGYDWSDSIFDDPATRFLTGVIYFNRGDYSSRKFLFNPQVATTSRAHPRREAFDMEKFLSNPNPKIFDPKKVVTASELFDVDEFVRTIHEGRDVALKDSQEWFSTPAFPISSAGTAGLGYIERIRGRRALISFQTLEEIWYGAYSKDWGKIRMSELTRHLDQYETVWASPELVGACARLRASGNRPGGKYRARTRGSPPLPSF